MRKTPKPSTSKTPSWTQAMVTKHGTSGHVANPKGGK